jgi:pilus assembly protein CpaF
MTDTAVLDYQLVTTLQGRVADEMTRAKQTREARGQRELSEPDERQLALSVITKVVQRHLASVLAAGGELPADAGYDRKLIETVDAAMFEAAEFQDLITDQDIENVDINGCDEVFITYADRRGKVRGRPIAATDDELVRIVQNLASRVSLNPRPFSRANPELDLRLPDGSRLSAVMGAAERPVVSIRRSRYPQMFLSTLVSLGTVDDRLACFLQAAVTARLNIVIGGATDAGKTTLLRALANAIVPIERLITVERSLELGLRRHPELHPDVVELEEVLPDADGNGGLSIRDLVRRTRRHNPDRCVLGEVMGPEVVEMLSAMSQGNNGSLSTIHARSASDVFAKLATYAAQYEKLDFAVAHSLIANAVDLVVFIEKNPLLGGRRCVAEVREVVGAPDGRVASGLIFGRSPVDGRAVRAEEFGLTFERNTALQAAGYDDTAHCFTFGGR